MGKKRGGKKSSEKISLESAIGSDEEFSSRNERIQILDPMDLQDEQDEFDLKKRLERSSKRNKRKSTAEVMQISDSDSDDDFKVLDPKTVAKQKRKEAKKNKKNVVEDEEDEEDEEEFEEDDENIGGESWGKQKKFFYGGNPNEKFWHKKKVNPDDEDEELNEAEMEAQESKKLQKKLLEQMDEDDYFEQSFTPTTTTKKSDKSEKVLSDLSKLSKNEKRKLFEKEAPEFKPILEDFESKMLEAEEKLAPLVRLMDQGLINENPATTFIRTKYQLIMNYCTNIACYVMFRAKRANLKLHPITSRLVQFKKMLDELDELDEKVLPQVERLIETIRNGADPEEVIKAEKRKAM